MSDENKLPALQRIAFGTGHILNIMTVVGMWYPYSVTFFQKVLLLSASSTATIVLVSQVVGAIVTPFIGIWSDSCVCKYGRRKIFHLIGIISVASSFFFIWFHCIGCDGVEDSYKIVYYSSFAVVFQFGWACTQICQLALIPELASSKATKVELNSIRYGVQVGSAMLVFILMWILLVILDQGLKASTEFGPHTNTTFWMLAVIVVVFGFLASTPFQIFIREKSDVKLKKLQWYKWLQNPQFYLAICTFVVSKIITVIPMTYIPLYFLDTLKMYKTSIAVGPLVFYVTSCIITPFVKKINGFIGIKLMYFIGLVIICVTMVWFQLHPATSNKSTAFLWQRDDIYFAIILFGIGGTTISVMALTILSLLVGEYSGSGAFVYGWAFFGDRFSNGIINNIILRVNHQSSDTSFYRYVIVYVSLVASILGLVTIIAMKVLELWQSRRKSECKDTEPQTVISETNYGSIQNCVTINGSTVPLLTDGTGHNGAIVEEKQSNKQESVENSPQNHQDNKDTKEELCDLSIFKSV